MLTLPKQWIQPKQKSPPQSIINQTETRKRPNINQVKEEIEFILKRNNRSFSLNAQKQSQKSQKYLHTHLLQRKRSKILQRTNQQNIQKAKNNRKLYEDYLLNHITSKNHLKSIEAPNQYFQTLTLKQTSYGKQMHKEFSISKTDFNSHRTLSYDTNKKQQDDKSIFSEKQVKPLGLGKLLFYKDANVKIKRSNLLNGQSFTQRRNLFKQTAMESFYHEPSLDITRYLKPSSKPAADEQQAKQKPIEFSLTKDKSFQIFKKQIIPKNPVIEQLLPTSNPEQLRVMGTLKSYGPHYHQRQVKRITKYDISPHLRQKDIDMNKTLNVMDEQLLVYYGKLRNRKLVSHYVGLNPKSTLNRSHSKNSSSEKDNLAKILDLGVKTSIDMKKPANRQNYWKIHNLDPWEKLKLEDQFDNSHVFGSLENDSSQEITKVSETLETFNT